MRRLLVFALPLLLLVTGCAHLISEQSRVLADQSITFDQLREPPQAYRGKLVLLGGNVAEVTKSGEGVRLLVIEHRLDSRELPVEVLPSRGCFLAITAESLDSDTYKPGALVTMMGEVTGEKTQPPAGAEHGYPVIIIREIHAFEIEELHPEYDLGP
jgi:outer membrane lipoprotein